jgi:hypothetical protein
VTCVRVANNVVLDFQDFSPLQKRGMMNLSIIFDDSNRFRRFSTASTVVRLLIDIISLFPGKSAAAGDDSSMQPSCSEADPDSLSDTAVSWSCEEQTQQRCKKISQKIAICSSAGILH